MGKKKSKAPRFLESNGSASASSYLHVKPGSGAVTLSSCALPPATTLSQLPLRDAKSKAPDTAGAAWGHMRAPTLTTELKRELLLVKMRGALDPKRFYRAPDKALPKYFQIGTVVEGSGDGPDGRMRKRERKGSILNEVLADGAITKRAKSQFLKSQTAASSGVKRRPNMGGGNKSKSRAGKKRG